MTVPSLTGAEPAVTNNCCGPAADDANRLHGRGVVWTATGTTGA